MPSGFLSYRHESDAHSQCVRDLAQQLLDAGLEVVLDQLMQEDVWKGAGPDKGWGSGPTHRSIPRRTTKS
ncbi:MAG: hypothetical protein ACI8UO_004968 [Verrucomicrobiales bacterium]|jgi:hypothetical protein